MVLSKYVSLCLGRQCVNIITNQSSYFHDGTNTFKNHFHTISISSSAHPPKAITINLHACQQLGLADEALAYLDQMK